MVRRSAFGGTPNFITPYEGIGSFSPTRVLDWDKKTPRDVEGHGAVKFGGPNRI